MNWYKQAITYNDKEQKMYSFLSSRMGDILSQITGIDINISFVEFVVFHFQYS